MLSLFRSFNASKHSALCLFFACGSTAIGQCPQAAWVHDEHSGYRGFLLGGGFILSATAWDDDGAGPGTEKLVVGGSFLGVETVITNGISLFDGLNWHPIGSGVTSSGGMVNALTTWNQLLIAGGNFAEMGGSQGTRAVAAWDGTQWSPLGEGVLGNVMCAEVFQDSLYVGGQFSVAGTVASRGIAKWNGVDWESLNGGIAAGTLVFVRDMTVHNGTLVAGGAFTGAGGILSRNAIAWDGTQWHALGGGLTRNCAALATFNDSLFAGTSTTDGCRLWRLDEGGWTTEYDFPPISIREVVATDDSLIVVTNRGDAIPNGIWRKRDGIAWQQLATSDVAPPSAIARVNSQTVVVGAESRNSGCQYSNGYLTDSGLVPMATNSFPYTIQQFGNSGGRLFARAGQCANDPDHFTGVEVLEGNKWRQIETPPGRMTDLRSIDDRLFLCVHDENQNGTLHLYEHIGTSWQAVGPPMVFSGTSNRQSRTRGITPFQGTLALCGRLGMDGIFSPFVLHEHRWSPLGSGFLLCAPNSEPIFSDILVFDGSLVVGGRFVIEARGPCEGVARWSGTKWEPMGSSFDGEVTTLETFRGELYAGGSMRNSGALPTSGIARWNGANWLSVGGGLSIQFGNPVGRVLLRHNGELWVAGEFNAAGSVPTSCLAAWDGEHWRGFIEGPSSAFINDPPTVIALASYEGQLHMSGLFSLVDDLPSYGWARLNQPGPRILESPRDQTICLGSPMTLHVRTDATDATYQWRFRGADLPGEVMQDLTISAISAAQAGWYDCLVTSSCGTQYSADAYVQVLPHCALPCDSIDFNGDGAYFDPVDIDAFLSVYSEGPCIPATALCGDIDFNNDTSLFDPRDIESFLSVYGEGPCI